MTIATLSGAKLFHEGQFEGRKVKLPVFLGRRPDEIVATDLQAFYYKLFKVIKKEGLLDGEWQLCERKGWPDNQSYFNLVAWCWSNGKKRYLIIINLSETHSQGLVRVPWDDIKSKVWEMNDVMSGAVIRRSGDEMSGQGFYVDLTPWGYHFLRL